jgi:hypothetical protein
LFGLTAFDSLDGQFVDIGTEEDLDSGLTLQQAQAVASGCASRVNKLPQRLQEPIQKLEDVLGMELKEIDGWVGCSASYHGKWTCATDLAYSFREVEASARSYLGFVEVDTWECL